VRKMQLWAAVLTASLAASAATADAPKYTTDSTMGELLDNPSAHAILAKYLPDVVSSPQIDQGRGLTLKSLQQFLPNLTDEMLKQIGDELAKIPS
jgi:hypothetical protein